MSLDRTVTVPAGFTIDFEQKKHEYFIHSEEGREKVPSWTKVLDVLDKPGLPWWGMKIGVEGVCSLLSGGEFEDTREANALSKTAEDHLTYGEVSEVVDLLTKHKLTVNHVRDKAADRGTDVHVAAARWAEQDEWPDPLAYPEEQMGYVTALADWLTKAEPEVLGAEQIVGSPLLGYAGTLDLRCRIGDRMGIVDYKTTTSIRHPSHDYQLAGYELASQESGYAPTDFQAVLRLDADGTWEWYETKAKPYVVQHLVAIYYENKRINEELKADRKKAKQEAKA